MILIFSGFNKRYKYINNILLDKFPGSSIVIQKDFKGDHQGKYDNDPQYDRETIELFENHIQERDKTESKFYPEDKFYLNEKTKYLYTTSKELNSEKTIKFVNSLKPKIVFVFGVGLLNNKLLQCFEKTEVINLHFGITPKYRGSNTLLWTLYLNDPGHLGITLHRIDSKVDHGPIYHQQSTKFSKKDSIHEIFCKTIIQAVNPTVDLIEKIINKTISPPIKMSTPGKIYNNNEFTPLHLKSIYKSLKNGLLVKYLDEKSNFEKPKLISVLKQN